MAIASSVYEADPHTQANGRRWVRETHTHTDGTIYRKLYLAEGDADLAALLTAHAAQLEAELAAAEIEEVLG